MVRFHGVSTKYLDSYLGWMRIIDTQKGLTSDNLLGLIARHREEKKSFHH